MGTLRQSKNFLTKQTSSLKRSSKFKSWLSKRNAKLNKKLRYPKKKLAKLETPVNEICDLVFNLEYSIQDENEDIDDDEHDMLDIGDEEIAESISVENIKNEIDGKSELEKNDL